MMYLYFDVNGNLKEIVQNAVREGSDNVNKIYIYVEPQTNPEPELNDEDIYVYPLPSRWTNAKINFKLLNSNVNLNNNSIPMDKVTDIIPQNKDRDIYFFKYGYSYEFWSVTLPAVVTAETGVISATAFLFTTNDQLALNTFNFNVESSVMIIPDSTITESQYSYLYNLYQNIVAGNAYVPYTGAEHDVDLGQNKITAKEFKLTSVDRIYMNGSDLLIETDSGDINLRPDGFAKIWNKEIATKEWVNSNFVPRSGDFVNEGSNGLTSIYNDTNAGVALEYVNGDNSADIRIYQGVPELKNVSENYEANLRVGTQDIRIERRNTQAGTSESLDLFAKFAQIDNATQYASDSEILALFN